MTAPSASSPCDPERTGRFLAGDLSVEDQRVFEAHLEACAVCRAALETQSAPPDWWRRPAEFLTADALDDQVVCRDRRTTAGGTAAGSTPRHDGLARVLERLAPSDHPHMLGRLGRYEIAGAIGFGGMAVVLKGFEPTLNRYVAIKVLAPHLADSESARQRFSREALAAASVLHPNVIAIHQVAESDGLPYLVMPYIGGGSLQDRLDKEGTLPLVSTVRIGMQVAAGLAAAHAQGLVHRDIKPANILLEPGLERVVITDFGLARAADDASITQTGILAGTPHYMSPEQARGERIDSRSDLFSLGSLMYAMLAGQVPFQASTSYGVLRRITDHAAPEIQSLRRDIPKWFGRLMRGLHARQCAARFQHASEVAELLEQCLAALQHSQNPLPPELADGLWMRLKRPLVRQRKRPGTGPRWGGAATVLAGLVAVCALAMSRLPLWRAGEVDPTPPAVVWPSDGAWATLRGRFYWEGDRPESPAIVPTRDSQLYPRSIPDEGLLLGAAGGIANVFVWIDADTIDVHPDRQRLPHTTVPAHFHLGRITPHAFTLRTTQTLSLGNRDPIEHQVRIGARLAAALAPGGGLAREFAPSREAPLAIACEFHPWQRSHFLVLDHPYMTLTDAQGRFSLTKVPKGRWTLRFWHESIGPVRTVVDEDGQVRTWPRGQLTLDVDRPEIELGEWVPQLVAFEDVVAAPP